MADVLLKPIVIPRAWDGHRIHFAVLFSFEVGTSKGVATETRAPITFDNWPTSLERLGWHRPDQPEQLTPEQAASRLHLVLTRDDEAGTPLLSAVTLANAFDANKGQQAWQAIFGTAWNRSGEPEARRESGLAAIFKSTQAPDQSRGGAANSHGRNVAINPPGGSDLRPTQRIESLELKSARIFLGAVELHTAALAKADRHQLAKAKAKAFSKRQDLSQATKSLLATQTPALDFAEALSRSVELDTEDRELVVALHLAHEAGVDGARLQRSVGLARNRPAKGIDSKQATHPGRAEILARLKQHPGAMRVLGLVIDCTAPFDPRGATSVTGKIAMRLAGLGDAIEPLNVATRFELSLESKDLTYFRAAERDDHEIDGDTTLWKKFHLLPPKYFSLRQDDQARALMRAQSSLSGTRSGDTDESLTDAIIIQAEHPQGQSVADIIHKRLQHAQLTLNGKVGQPAPARDAETELFAEDLMSGVTFEVASGDSTRIIGNWHSLCRRLLVVNSAGKELFRCEEDGYVSTSVATSAAPLVGTITAVAKAADDKTNLDKYLLKIARDGAYNTPSPPDSTASFLVTARRTTPLSTGNQDLNQNAPAQSTQLRSIIRETSNVADLNVNLTASDKNDRVQLTIGPTVAETDPTLVESMFLSPLFSTAALNDPTLPQTGLQIIRMENKLRSETFHLAFEGSVTEFLNADGTVFSAKPADGATSWLPGFETFEAEGERRAYLRTASDVTTTQSLEALSVGGHRAATISDSLPQAALTTEHASQAGQVSLLSLPFLPPGKLDRFTKLEPPASTVYPLYFRFRGSVASAHAAGDDGVALHLAQFNPNDADPILQCPASAISDRGGKPVVINAGDIVAGDGILESPSASFRVVQLHVLGQAGSIFAEAAAARSDPFMAWLPRVARVEQKLQPLRGPVDGRIGFDCAGKIKVNIGPTQSFAVLTATGPTSPQQAYTTVSWSDLAAKEPLPKRWPAKIVLPTTLATTAPATDFIASAKGRVEKIVFLDSGGQPAGVPETVLLVEAWNVLASGSIFDQDLSDAARAAKATPHLDWIVTISTDDRGDVPVLFDATFAPTDPTALFHPLDLWLQPDDKAPQPIWTEVICVGEIGQLRGIGWPGWISGYSAAAADATATKLRTLTLLDLRSLQISRMTQDNKPLDDGAEQTGYFRLAGPRGSVSWNGDPGPAAAPDKRAYIPKLSLLRLLGELVTIEIDGENCVLHVTALSGQTPWQLQLRCRPTDRFGDITPDLLSRRAVDLLPGDCVFAIVRPDPKGWFEIISVSNDPNTVGAPADAPAAIALAAGLSGRWTPVAASPEALARAVVTSGSVDFLPGTVVTHRGISRQIFAPKGTRSASKAPSDPSNLLLESPQVDDAMLRFLSVAFARTLIAHQPPAQLTNPSRNPKEGETLVSLPAVHAVASDALARWRGWWLTVPQPGDSDLQQEKITDGWPIRLDCKPSGLMLPLRKGQSYWIRGWRTDLAGNIGYQNLSAQARDALDHLQVKSPLVFAKVQEFQRPDLPLAPVMAQPGKLLNHAAFAFVAYGLPVDPDTVAEQAPGTSSQSLQLVLVTNRKGEAVAPKRLSYASCYLLPPPVDVETVLSSGKLDPDRKKVKGAAALAVHAAYVSTTIQQHEQFYDDHLLGRRPSVGLNYFPDPFATDVVLSVGETLLGTLQQTRSPNGLGNIGQWSRPSRLSLYPKGNWPKGDVTAKVELAKATLQVPAARAARAQIVATEPGSADTKAITNPGLTVDLIHAVTGPLRQPEWIDLVGDPPRKPSDTAQEFKGQLGIDVPSTGSVAFSLSWSDLWDETVPALFGAAKVRAQTSNGVIAKVLIDDPGFGYGSEAVVKSIEADTGDGAVLKPVVKDSKLVAVTIESGGAGYPNEDIAVTIVRRPPLHTLAVAKAKVAGGKILAVALADGTETNGYYARPPLVRFLDMKGTGYNAECRAIVHDGSVTEFKVEQPGQGYSDNVLVGLYTDEAAIPEQQIPDRSTLDDPVWNAFPFDIHHAFGDTRARHLNFVGHAHTRFRDEVEVVKEEPMTTEPRRLELVSSARPPKPEIAYLLPSFVPINTLEKRNGLLVEQRDAMIRCYVHRPWNATGDEWLGVVVYAAQVNTSRIRDDAFNEGLIPTALRKYVSRWAFDPVWDDVATAPLTVDDFTNAVEVVRYDDVAELAGGEVPPVGVALHAMHYSAERDMWYADVAVRAPENGMPFVQLAFVRYQPNSVQGLSMSEVALADPIVVPGQRRLTVRRSQPGNVMIKIEGNFDGARTDKRKLANLPARMIVVELRKRLANLPLDIEGPLAHSDDSIGGDSLDRWELQRAPDRTSFSGKISLEPGVIASAKNYYLAVKEFEVFPSAASYRDNTGTTGTVTGKQPTFGRLVYYRPLGVEELPNA